MSFKIIKKDNVYVCHTNCGNWTLENINKELKHYSSEYSYYSKKLKEINKIISKEIHDQTEPIQKFKSYLKEEIKKLIETAGRIKQSYNNQYPPEYAVLKARLCYYEYVLNKIDNQAEIEYWMSLNYSVLLNLTKRMNFAQKKIKIFTERKNQLLRKIESTNGKEN